MTVACLKLLYEAGHPVWPWKETGRGLLAEAFPAAQLCSWGLTHQGYSRRTDVEMKTRCSIVAAISKSINLARFRDTVEQSADALDAVICAFAATAVADGDVLFYAAIHCNDEPMSSSGPRLMGHCRLRKYAVKVKEWHGVCLRPSDSTLRFGVSLNYEWEHDPEMDALASRLRKPVPFEDIISGVNRKIGRNEPCPCNSGLKYKKCHGK